MKRIALIGDYSEGVTAHRAIPIALRMAVERLRADISWEWIHSRGLGNEAGHQLEAFSGVWCVPGSPYENTDGVLSAIRFARESHRPFLGTCGGFQHALIEYADAVWGIEAAHAELDAHAENPVIAPLMCSLIEVKGALHFAPGSRLARIYGSTAATEEYHCSYGVNPAYQQRFATGPLKVAARDDGGDIRALELDAHPFYIGTLFQPERAALRDQLPPLITAFVGSVAAHGVDQ